MKPVKPHDPHPLQIVDSAYAKVACEMQILSQTLQQEDLRASPTRVSQFPGVESFPLEKTPEPIFAPTNKGRRVHFEVDDYNTLILSVCVYPAVPARYRQDVYMSKDEQLRVRWERKQSEAKYVRRRDYRYAIEHLLDSPMQCHLWREDMTDEEAIATVTEGSYARGLETRLSTSLRRHNKWAITIILHRHHQLSDSGVEHPEVLLRTTSEQASKCSRDFAFKLAKGDRLEALKVYQELLGAC